MQILPTLRNMKCFYYRISKKFEYWHCWRLIQTYCRRGWSSTHQNCMSLSSRSCIIYIQPWNMFFCKNDSPIFFDRNIREKNFLLCGHRHQNSPRQMFELVANHLDALAWCHQKYISNVLWFLFIVKKVQSQEVHQRKISVTLSNSTLSRDSYNGFCVITSNSLFKRVVCGNIF